jgi:ribosomal-protein-alanine N-acetyltransferase
VRNEEVQTIRLLAVPDAWEDPIFTPTQAKNTLAQAGNILLQAQGGGHLLGFASAGAAADILTLYVPENLRRQGRAEALLQAFFAHAKAQGATGLTLEVRADNATAITIYTKLGLTEQHRRVGYYGGVDALIMETIL